MRIVDRGGLNSFGHTLMTDEPMTDFDTPDSVPACSVSDPMATCPSHLNGTQHSSADRQRVQVCCARPASSRSSATTRGVLPLGGSGMANAIGKPSERVASHKASTPGVTFFPKRYSRPYRARAPVPRGSGQRPQMLGYFATERAAADAIAHYRNTVSSQAEHSTRDRSEVLMKLLESDGVLTALVADPCDPGFRSTLSRLLSRDTSP